MDQSVWLTISPNQFKSLVAAASQSLVAWVASCYPIELRERKVILLKRENSKVGILGIILIFSPSKLF